MKPSQRIATLNGTPGGDDGWSILYAARDRLAAGERVTMLCIGDHDMPTPEPIVDAARDALAGGNTRYVEVDGAPALRAAIARRVTSQSGIPTGPRNVFVTGGGQGALFAAMMGAIDPGETCVIVDPYYTTYPATVRAASGRPRVVRADPDRGFQIDRTALLDATNGAAALLVNTPNNPTGAVYDADTLANIREACLSHDLWCLSDEVYDTQVHDGSHVSPRQLDGMAERTLVIGSLSKSHIMTGFRIGWLIGPPPLIDAMTGLANATTYGEPGFVQDAALAALERYREEAETARLYTRRRNAAIAALAGQNAVRLSPPSGAMYVMLDIRATGLSGLAFARCLLDRDAIAVMPGESFGAAAAGHVRIALTVPEAVLVPALGRIAARAAELAS